jgi:hypothetical protein
MSALPPKADIRECEENVRFGPKADIPRFIRLPRQLEAVSLEGW